MPNIDQRFGLAPIRHLNGNPWNGQTQPCNIGSGYAVNLFVGDPVILTPTLTESEVDSNYPTINVAGTGDASVVFGVITSFDPEPGESLERIYSPASTAGVAQVCIDPDVIFIIRDDAAGTPAKDFAGMNADLVSTHSGSTVTGFSGFELAGDTVDADQTAQLWILARHRVEDTTLADRALWEVLINTHVLNGGGAGRILGVDAA